MAENVGIDTFKRNEREPRNVAENVGKDQRFKDTEYKSENLICRFKDGKMKYRIENVRQDYECQKNDNKDQNKRYAVRYRSRNGIRDRVRGGLDGRFLRRSGRCGVGDFFRRDPVSLKDRTDVADSIVCTGNNL